MQFRVFLENVANIKLHLWHLNSHSGQNDYVVYATVDPNDTVIGKLEFSEFENVPLIKWIEVSPEYRRQGIGQKMVQRLTQEYPYHKIKWGYTTQDGMALKSKMDGDDPYIKRGYDMYGKGIGQ